MKKDKMKEINDPKDVPNLKTPEEKADYWSSHRPSSEFWDKAVHPPEDTLPPRTKTISLRLEQDTLQKLKTLAGLVDRPYQTLLKEFVTDRLNEEEPDHSTGSEAELARAYQQQNQQLQKQLAEYSQQLNRQGITLRKQSRLIEELSQRVEQLSHHLGYLTAYLLSNYGVSSTEASSTSWPTAKEITPWFPDIGPVLGGIIASSATNEAEMRMMEDKKRTGRLLAGHSE